MEVVVIIGAIVAVVVALGKSASKPNPLQLAAVSLGRTRHLRSGEFPSSCSWCKNTTLARKLFLFERSPEGWRAADVMTQLETCADADVPGLADILSADQPRWRRLCSERCARELGASEHVAIAEAFGSCDYCSVRAPVALHACPNCGAQRTG